MVNEELMRDMLQECDFVGSVKNLSVQCSQNGVAEMNYGINREGKEVHLEYKN